MHQGDLLNDRSEEHTSELQSPCNLVCRLLLEKKNEVAFLLFGETLYRSHPYRFDTLGTESSVARLEPGLLAQYRARQYPAAAVTLSILGDVDPEEVRERVRRTLTAAPPAPRAIPPAREGPPPAPRCPRKKLHKRQAHIV